MYTKMFESFRTEVLASQIRSKPDLWTPRAFYSEPKAIAAPGLKYVPRAAVVSLASPSTPSILLQEPSASDEMGVRPVAIRIPGRYRPEVANLIRISTSSLYPR